MQGDKLMDKPLLVIVITIEIRCFLRISKDTSTHAVADIIHLIAGITQSAHLADHRQQTLVIRRLIQQMIGIQFEMRTRLHIRCHSYQKAFVQHVRMPYSLGCNKIRCMISLFQHLFIQTELVPCTGVTVQSVHQHQRWADNLYLAAHCCCFSIGKPQP